MTQTVGQDMINARAQSIVAASRSRDGEMRRGAAWWTTAGMMLALGLTNGWAVWLVAGILDPNVIPHLLP